MIVAVINITMSDRQVREFTKQLRILPIKRQKKLVNDIAQEGARETRRKLDTGGGVPPSKWIRARKGVNKAMVGASDKVTVFQTGDNRAIVDTIDPRYSLGKHARGYTKPAGSGGPEDRVFGDWVVIPLKQPSELTRLRSRVPNPFRFKWTTHKRPSVVPARDVIASDKHMATQGNLIAQKWAQRILSEALSKVGL
jgi:hypothetical protein